MKTHISVADLAKDLKAMATGGPTAPLVLAERVYRVNEHWDDEQNDGSTYRQDAGGQDFSQWIERVSGHKRRWWVDRYDAVKFWGESCRRTLDHNVAVRLCKVLSDNKRDAALRVLRAELHANHEIPVQLSRALKALRAEKLIGPPLKRGPCNRCPRLLERIKLLEQTIRDLGGEVPKNT